MSSTPAREELSQRNRCNTWLRKSDDSQQFVLMLIVKLQTCFNLYIRKKDIKCVVFVWDV